MEILIKISNSEYVLADDSLKGKSGLNYNFVLKSIMNLNRDYEENSSEWKYCYKITHSTDKKNGGGLSLRNCQAVENGYDLDELSSLSSKSLLTDVTTREKLNYIIGYQMGFQKALEILADKKFSESDVREAIDIAWHDDNIDKTTIIQSLQQTHWIVDIITEPMNIDEIREQRKGFLNCNNVKPKLDTNGCLILKRK